MTLRDTADQIIRASLRAVQPDAAVQRALQEFSCAGRVVLIAIGKAAWAMANAAWDTLSTRITSGACCGVEVEPNGGDCDAAD